MKRETAVEVEVERQSRLELVSQVYKEKSNNLFKLGVFEAATADVPHHGALFIDQKLKNTTSKNRYQVDYSLPQIELKSDQKNDDEVVLGDESNEPENL